MHPYIAVLAVYTSCSVNGRSAVMAAGVGIVYGLRAGWDRQTGRLMRSYLLCVRRIWSDLTCRFTKALRAHWRAFALYSLLFTYLASSVWLTVRIQSTWYNILSFQSCEPRFFCRAMLMLCKRGLCRHAVSICLSVRPSRSSILSKRINISSKLFPSGIQTILVFPY